MLEVASSFPLFSTRHRTPELVRQRFDAQPHQLKALPQRAATAMLRAALLAATAAALRPPQARVSTTKKLDVVVVGGGISGLATALELARRGRSVRVVSRDLAKSATLAAGDAGPKLKD